MARLRRETDRAGASKATEVMRPRDNAALPTVPGLSGLGVGGRVGARWRRQMGHPPAAPDGTPTRGATRDGDASSRHTRDASSRHTRDASSRHTRISSHTARRPGRTPYAPYNPAMLEKYVTIFRAGNNFVFVGDDGATPAMRLGSRRSGSSSGTSSGLGSACRVRRRPGGGGSGWWSRDARTSASCPLADALGWGAIDDTWRDRRIDFNGCRCARSYAPATSRFRHRGRLKKGPCVASPDHR